MTDSSEAVENQLNPTKSQKPESMVEKLLRRKFAAGVALPQIRRRLTRITKASSKIRKNRLVLPGHTQRQQIKNFSTNLQQKQAGGPRVGSRAAANRSSSSWEHLDMDLPNGAPADSPRSNILRAGLDNAGLPSGGQVITPFDPPSSPSNEPSFVERRKARIAAQEPKKTSTAREKRDSSSRLYSRVEEIKPSNEKKREITPVEDQDFSRPMAARPDPVDQPKPDQPEAFSSPVPKVTPGKSSRVQREAVHPSAPGPVQGAQPEPQRSMDAPKPILPASSREELPMDLKTSPERKPTAKSAAEVQSVPPSKPQSGKPSSAAQPRAGISSPVDPASRMLKTEESTAASGKELQGKPVQAPQPLADKKRELGPRPPLPARKPDEGQSIEKLEKNPLDSSRSTPQPSAASASQSIIQRESEQSTSLNPEVLPAASEPDKPTEFQLPLEQPLAPRKQPVRPEEEAAAQTLNLPDVNQRSAESRESSSNRRSDTTEKLKPAVLPEKSPTIPESVESAFQDSAAVKPVVFQTVLARQRRKPRSPLQFPKRLAVQSAAIRRMYTPQRIRVQDAPNLIRRQIKRGISQEVQQVAPAPAIQEKRETETKGILPVNPQTTQPSEAPAEKILLQRSAVRRADGKVPIAPLTRSPLRLSLRTLTASQAALAAVRLRKQDTGETIRREKPSDLKPVWEKDQPLLLSQRRQLPDFAVKDTQNTNTSNVLPVRSSASAESKPGVGVDSASTRLRFRGKRLLVTGSGRQLIQRQVREAYSSSGKINLPEKSYLQESADKTALEQTSYPQQALLIQHSGWTESVQKPAQKKKNISDRIVKAVKSSGTIPASSEMNQPERPETELPVVSSKKTSPIEPVVQREMAVQGPVVQRAMAEPVENTTSPSQDTAGEPLDLDQLAREVYPIIKRMIAVERERSIGRLY